MNRDLGKFLSFLAVLGLMALGGYVITEAGLPRGYALPFGLLWLFGLLAGIGFVIGGKSDAKRLVSITVLGFAATIIGASVLWLAVSGAFVHNP